MTLDELLASEYAIKGVESSGGNYGALGPRTKKGDRAYGAYQVMGNNVGPWTEKHYGQRLTLQEFLANKQAQDAVFRGEFGSYLQRYGNVNDAASMWFSGKPYSGNTASDGYNTVPQYVAKVNAYLGKAAPQADMPAPNSQPVGGYGGVVNRPGGFAVPSQAGLLADQQPDYTARGGADSPRELSGHGPGQAPPAMRPGYTPTMADYANLINGATKAATGILSATIPGDPMKIQGSPISVAMHRPDGKPYAPLQFAPFQLTKASRIGGQGLL